MANYLGSVSWGIVPLNSNNSSNLASMSWEYRRNYLKSANDQLRYQVQWMSTGLNEGIEPSKDNYDSTTQDGDIVSVIFKIETSVDTINWNTIGTIKKSRDIANKRYATVTPPPAGHRFTIDISQLVSDQLSYSLCPINKGTWHSNYYGGMNGGITMQDNVIGSSGALGSPISNYNVSENGTFRRVRVSARFDIINSDGEIVVGDTTLTYPPYITVINSVNQFEKDSLYYFNSYNIADSESNKYEFLTRCPNWRDGSLIQDFRKPVRIDEQAEWLQFYIQEGESKNITSSSSSSANQVCAMGIEIITYTGDVLQDTFYLTDFQQNILQTTYGSNSLATVDNDQNQMFIQNISPFYINNTAALKKLPTNPPTRSGTDIADNWDDYVGDKITDSITRYDAFLVKVALFSPYPAKRITKVYKYTIDKESENIPYGFVRFHWLNSLGATDSYTAKRDVLEGLTISRDVVERKSSDRTWYQGDKNQGADLDNSLYISDTMRGGNIYKGGREVSSVNADKVQSVYTEPLNKSVAKWLEGMMLSPNVWIEMDTEATAVGKAANPYLRPSTKEYIPVIITNSDIETVNQENGLVKFNIEYILAHKVKTQRN